ncbi:MAG: hypothetical protein ACTSU5_02395 [Promethearchaeota archaeon]
MPTKTPRKKFPRSSLDHLRGSCLVITDLHLDSREVVFTGREVRGTLALLGELAHRYGARDLFVLGDVFIMQEDNVGFMVRVLGEVSDAVPGRVVILPGNHDRNLPDLIGGLALPRVEFVRDTGFDLAMGGRTLVHFTHDAGGGYYSDLANPGQFLEELREIQGVSPGTWLVAGHAHQNACFPGSKCACLGPFSVAAGKVAPSPDQGPSFLVFEADPGLDLWSFSLLEVAGTGSARVVCRGGKNL